MLTWLEVDLGAIRNNINQIKKYIEPQVGLAAVVKSNAYGHGLVEVAKAVSQVGVEFLCVDNVSEAKALQATTYPDAKIGIPHRAAHRDKLQPKILILGGVESEDLPWVIKNGIRFGVYDLSFAKKAEKIAKKLRKKALVHIKVDTGMHRLGFDAKEAIDSIIKINRYYKKLEMEGIWSHFADSGSEKNKKYTLSQIEKFKNIINGLEDQMIDFKYKHLCNSSGLITLPEAHFNLVRAGVLIYGIFPSELINRKYNHLLKLKPALNFKTRVISIRHLFRGERIGYGLTHKLKKNSKVAVLAVGYKDGYGRDLSDKGEVIIKKNRCKVLGRICMRMMMVDVSSVANIKLDDEVILLGSRTRARIEAPEVAQKMDTIPYEVVARISESVPRIYKNN